MLAQEQKKPALDRAESDRRFEEFCLEVIKAEQCRADVNRMAPILRALSEAEGGPVDG